MSLPNPVIVPDEVMSMDQGEQRIMMENHILKNKVTLGQLYNGQRLETIGGKMLRVFIYRAVRSLAFLHTVWLGAPEYMLRGLQTSPSCQSSYA